MNNHFIYRCLLFSFIWLLLNTSCTSRQVSLENLLQADLDELCKKHNLPGMTAAFVMENGTIGSVASGLADKEYNMQMTPQSRMLAASIGKSFVAATCVELAQKGVLNQSVTNEIEDRFRDVLYNIELESGQVISTFIYPRTFWNQTLKYSPLYIAVKKEGIKL
jgi:CubicO group peptidase (beta-lactamase class C family)